MPETNNATERRGLVEIKVRSASSGKKGARSLDDWLNHVCFGIDEEFTKDEPRAQRCKETLPSSDGLHRLVELVGEASLLSEEGEYHQLAVLYTASLKARVLKAVLPGKPSKPLTPSYLAKLAPICAPNHTYLLVDYRKVDRRKKALVCWGVADLTTQVREPQAEAKSKPNTEPRRFPQLDIALEPDSLWLHSLRPGHVEGGWKGRVIHWENPEGSDPLLYDIPAIKKRLETWSADEDWNDVGCNCYREHLFTFLLEHIIGMMVMNGAGGTLLLALNTPKGQPLRGKVDLAELLDLDPKGPIEPMRISDETCISARIRSCVDDFMDKKKGEKNVLKRILKRSLGRILNRDSNDHLLYPFRPRTELPHYLRALSGFVAKLSFIDGAVVLDDELDVLMFGAKIDVKAGRLTGNGKRELTRAATAFVEGHGTRHKSAITWVRAQSSDSDSSDSDLEVDRVALVVSSDRKATAVFINEQDEVHIQPVVYRRT